MVLDDPAVRVVVIPEHGGQHGFAGDFDRQVSCKLGPRPLPGPGDEGRCSRFQEWVTLEAGKRRTIQVDSSWVQLFNGKDLTGWKHAHWADPLWKVEAET